MIKRRNFLPAFAPALALVLSLALSLALTSCGEPAGDGRPANLPPVAVQCSAPGCRVDQAGVPIYAYWTTSSCQQPYFGAKILGVGSASCSAAGGCRGVVSSWADWSTQQRTQQAPGGSYSLCTVLDMNGNWVNYQVGADSGDMVGEITSVLLESSTPAQTVTSFWRKP